MTTPLNLEAQCFGSSNPRLSHIPQNIGTLGPSVRERTMRWGCSPDPWQVTCSDNVWRVTNDEHEFAADEIGILSSRRNGKSEFVLEFVLAHLFIFRGGPAGKTIFWSAHLMSTAIDGFRRLRAVIQSNPRLMAQVEKISEGNGKEAIYLKKRPGQMHGDCVLFITRSKNQARGFGADVIICDEAQEMSALAFDALTYTQDTKPNPQILYLGTAPSEQNDSQVWEEVRDRGRSGSAASTLWMEWSPTGSEDPKVAATLDLGRLDFWVESIPSLNYRIPLRRVQRQWDRLKDKRPESFARERLSVWPNRPAPDEVVRSRVDLDAWMRNQLPDVNRGHALPAVGVWLARSAEYATISRATRLPDGRILVETLDTRHQVMWLGDALADISDDLDPVSIAVDPKNAAMVLSGLTALGVKTFNLTITELCAAFGVVLELIAEGTIVHLGQADLTESLRNATTRSVGKYGETWDQSDPTEPITQVQSMTIAVYALLSAEGKPKKSNVVRGHA